MPIVWEGIAKISLSLKLCYLVDIFSQHLWTSIGTCTLTLCYMGLFWSFRHNLHSSNTIEILKLFFGLGHSWYPCDQIHMEIGPNQAFVLELWGSKVARGGHNDPPLCNVGLRDGITMHTKNIKKKQFHQNGSVIGLIVLD